MAGATECIWPSRFRAARSILGAMTSPTELDVTAARALITARREHVAARLADAERRLTEVRGVRGEWTDEEHDPEGFALTFEWQQAEGSRAEHRAELRELDDAEARVTAGAFGICEVCGQAIPLEQLKRRPARRICVACTDRRAR